MLLDDPPNEHEANGDNIDKSNDFLDGELSDLSGINLDPGFDDEFADFHPSVEVAQHAKQSQDTQVTEQILSTEDQT